MFNQGQTAHSVKSLIYRVNKLTEPMVIDCNWDKEPWKKVKPLEIQHYMGVKPQHRPRTQVRLLYDDEYIYVIFRVEDRFVKAIAKELHGPVWKDSCVEFFFTPGPDVKIGYFNLEANCGGTILFCYQSAQNQNQRFLDIFDCKRVEIVHSLPKLIYPEISGPVTWMLEYRIPIEILEKYCQVTKPVPGVTWRVNFYKCADAASHPHWLTWSPVAFDSPNFHLPEYFGTLEFVD